MKKLEPELEPNPKPNYRNFLLNLCKEFLNEIASEEKNINEEIMGSYFDYKNPSSLAKDLFQAD